jgi:hypothetical protein
VANDHPGKAKDGREKNPGSGKYGGEKIYLGTIHKKPEKRENEPPAPCL